MRKDEHPHGTSPKMKSLFNGGHASISKTGGTCASGFLPIWRLSVNKDVAKCLNFLICSNRNDETREAEFFVRLVLVLLDLWGKRWYNTEGLLCICMI